VSSGRERGREHHSAEIVPWGKGDLPLLERLVGDPAMMEHLGGPERPEQIRQRQARYEAPGSGCFKVLDRATGVEAGWVGYWEHAWRGQDVYEIGWSVLPECQGRGLASSATALALDAARARSGCRFVHAFPAVENGASNAICRKLEFVLIEACDFEFPPGNTMRCNDWRLDLTT
jgi:RimJ/RimL family protein N-acetyltransferase